MTEQNYARHAHQPRLTYAAGAFTLIAMISFVAAWFFGWVWRDLGMVFRLLDKCLGTDGFALFSVYPCMNALYP